MGEANSGKISLRLLIDKKEKRVIFGEAGKEFVDFLFHFLSLPVGTVVKILSKDKMVGSLGKVYESIESMDANYMEPNVNKEHVLNPKVSSSPLANTPFLLGNKICYELNDSKVYYSCHNDRTTSKCHTNYDRTRTTSIFGISPEINDRTRSTSIFGSPEIKCELAYVSDDPMAMCPSCHQHMNRAVTYVHGPGKEVVKVEKGPGYVKGLVTYMVMDNLMVKPMSTISSITLLSTFEVKDLSALETLEVCIGEKEAVEMLRASFVTDKVLTSLFLGNQKA